MTANHIIAQHSNQLSSTQLNSPHCHNGAKVCFSHCFVAHFVCVRLFVCSQLILAWNLPTSKNNHVSFRTAQSVLCKMTPLNAKTERKRDMQAAAAAAAAFGDSSDDLDMNPV